MNWLYLQQMRRLYSITWKIKFSTFNETKVIGIRKEDTEITIQLNIREIEQVDTFKCLGVKISKDGRTNDEVNDKSATKQLLIVTNSWKALSICFIQ